MGAVGLEPTETEVEGFTVPCNCHYATPPENRKNLLAKGIEPSTSGLQNRCSTTELHRPENRIIITWAVNISRPFSTNNYNSFIIARFVDSACACSVYLDLTQAWRKPGLSTFRNVISFVNLGISHCQRHETGERGYV